MHIVKWSDLTAQKRGGRGLKEGFIKSPARYHHWFQLKRERHRGMIAYLFIYSLHLSNKQCLKCDTNHPDRRSPASTFTLSAITHGKGSFFMLDFFESCMIKWDLMFIWSHDLYAHVHPGEESSFFFKGFFPFFPFFFYFLGVLHDPMWGPRSGGSLVSWL